MNKQLMKSALLAGMAFGAIAVQAMPASAFTTYTDRSAWETDVNDFETEDFGGSATGAQLSIDFGNFEVTSPGDNRGILVQETGSGFLKTRATTDGVEFIFDSAINGFFGDWGTEFGFGTETFLAGDFDGDGTEDTINLDDEIGTGSNSREGSLGIISNTAFDSFFLKRQEGGNGGDTISVDDLSYAAVPEPGSALAMLTVGAIATGGALKRKKQAA